jgi:hypothetical protein
MKGYITYKGNLYKRCANKNNIAVGDLIQYNPVCWGISCYGDQYGDQYAHIKYKGKYIITSEYEKFYIKIPKEKLDNKYDLMLKIGYNISYNEIILYKKVNKSKRI